MERGYEAAFERVSSRTFFIQANSMWVHRDRHPVTETVGNDSIDEMALNTSDLQNEEDGNQVFMDDAIEDHSSGDKPPFKGDDLSWEPSSQLVDSRLANPQESFQGHCSVRVPKDASLEAYFLAFLPMEHIMSTVIPAINHHALTVHSNWNRVSLSEYLMWIGLYLAMTVNYIPDKKAYWAKKDFSFAPSMDFSM
jgi:hypothetical protein